MRRASATGLLDNLGGEGQPLPESHGRDSSMGQAAIQQPRRVARRGPGPAPGRPARSPLSPRPVSGLTTAHIVSMHCSRTRPCSSLCAQAPHAGLDAEVRGCASWHRDMCHMNLSVGSPLIMTLIPQLPTPPGRTDLR